MSRIVMSDKLRGGIKMSNKKWLTLLIVLLIYFGSSVMLGCSNNNNAIDKAKITDQKEVPTPTPVQEPKKITPGITPIYAEAKPNAELEKTIIDYLEIPKDDLAKTKYYYNYVDLNMDKTNELFVVVMGPYTSGTGGNTALHIIQTNAGLKVKQKFTLIQTPVIISDTVTNGAKDLIVRKSGGGVASSYVVLTCKDGKYTTVNEGTAIPSLETVTGTAIISNDILKDMDEGKAFYLQQR